MRAPDLAVQTRFPRPDANVADVELLKARGDALCMLEELGPEGYLAELFGFGHRPL
jgi:hypothetical protein